MIKILETGQAIKRKAIAKRLCISLRTVYRDLALLRDMNVPIKYRDDAYSLDRRAWNKWTGQQIGQAIKKCNK